tara:strand:- start:484 stop:1230 length:747 start_codon:yes stop_codon:yes gene_type:complete
MFDVILLFLKGNFKRSKRLFLKHFHHYLDKRRVRSYFSPISKYLLEDQSDYRLVVYKNFDYKKSLYRETFEKFGSNKGGFFKYNNTIRHFYSDFYEECLKNKILENLLEIGVEFGGSLRAWSTLFPKANIYGADKNKEYLFNEGNIKTFYTDQLNKDELNLLFKKLQQIKFDVIIDDGLHNYDANINTFEALFPLLDQQNGIYFIEDILYKDLGKYYDYFYNKYNYKIIECLNTNENFMNCMILIKKS